MFSPFPDGKSYLGILARYLDIVVLAVRVLDQVVAHSVQRLFARPTVQILLVPISPSLKALTVLRQVRFMLDEVILKLSLPILMSLQ